MISSTALRRRQLLGTQRKFGKGRGNNHLVGLPCLGLVVDRIDPLHVECRKAATGKCRFIVQALDVFRQQGRIAQPATYFDVLAGKGETNQPDTVDYLPGKSLQQARETATLTN